MDTAMAIIITTMVTMVMAITTTILLLTMVVIMLERLVTVLITTMEEEEEAEVPRLVKVIRISLEEVVEEVNRLHFLGTTTMTIMDMITTTMTAVAWQEAIGVYLFVRVITYPA
jgi:delta-aminolevulinic acid dehydratase/porphobilinogen synthase